MPANRQTAHAAFWNVGFGLGARVLGLIGTIFMTRLLLPDIIGQVSAANILAQTANWVSHWGFNQYLLVHGAHDSEKTYHGAVMHLVFGTVGLLLIVGTGSFFAPLLNAPLIATFLPGLAIAVLIRRVGAVADKILAREMRFRELAIANGAGELLYATSALVIAGTTRLGGTAIVIANILQSTLTTSLILRATGLAWFQPVPWRWTRVREILRFGLPLGVGQLLNYGTRAWDNLAFGWLFGPTVLGFYNMAYNLADVPAVQFGEQMNGVLFPAMVNLPAEQRKAAVIRSTALMALIVFPLAVGLGGVAPTLVGLLLNDQWKGVAPFLTVLSVLSVVRPMAWGVTSYLAINSRTREIMMLEVLRFVLLFTGILAFAPWGPVWAAVAVGIAFGAQALATLALVIITDDMPAGPLFEALIRPLVACGVMLVAVLGTRSALTAGTRPQAFQLIVEVAVGAATYAPAAFVLAPDTSRDFIRLLRGALKR